MYVGLALMAAWNGTAVRMLLECKDAVQSQSLAGAEEVDANGLYAFIGRQACGRPGEAVVKACMGVTLFGAAVSYLVAATDIAQDTPLLALFGGGPALARLLSVGLSLLVVLPLSLRPFSFLSYTSVAGLCALGLAFLVLIAHGALSQGADATTPSPPSPSPSPWRAASLVLATDPHGLAEFFGVASFCFGIAPLAFPIQQAMRLEHAGRFPAAVRWSMASVAGLYILLAEAVAVLYPAPLPSNILLVLPAGSLLATAVRALVAVVCLLSYPLALVPLAESMEKAVARAARGHARGPVDDAETAPLRPGAAAASGSTSASTLPRLRLVVRAGLVVASAVVATVVPCFGIVVSFLGAFSIALLALVLPPFFHLCLVSTTRPTRTESAKNLALLVVGAVATIVATVLTAQAGFLSILTTHECPT